MQRLLKASVVVGLLASSSSFAAVCSRVKNFTNGSILTASDLNTEFNTIFDCNNAITTDQLSPALSVPPNKLAPSIAGDGIVRDSGTGVIAVNPDDITIQVAGDVVLIKDSGVSTVKLADLAVTTAKINDSAVTTAKINDAAVTTAKIADDAVTNDKVADNAVNTAQLVNGAVTQAKMGAANYVESLPIASFSLVSTGSWTTVTNLNVTITSTGGRPIVLQLMGTGTDHISYGYVQAGGGVGRISLLRDGSERIGSMAIDKTYPSTAFTWIDRPASGSRTYTVQVYKSGSGDAIFFGSTKLVAYEL